MIRWPQDALIFSVRVRGCGVYAAGYVEGDTSSQELLGAQQTSSGLELVSLRGTRPTSAELKAIRSLASDGVARVLDVFRARGSLQPLLTSAMGSVDSVIVVERLPADVHLVDLSRQLFRRSNGGARPPVGLALYLTREVARIYASAPSFAIDDDESSASSSTSLSLTRRGDNVLLAWDGSVHVQPRVAVTAPLDDGVDASVRACGHHLVRLLSGDVPDGYRRDPNDIAEIRALVEARADTLPGDVSLDVATLVRQAVGMRPRGAPDTLSLQEMIARLDELLIDEPFSSEDLAGTLAQLFAEERAQDLAFREELAACDLDTLTLPAVNSTEVDVHLLRE